MKKNFILSGLVILVAIIFSSCSQKQYYAFSYAPSGKAYHETKSSKSAVNDEATSLKSNEVINEVVVETTTHKPSEIKQKNPVVKELIKDENVLGTQKEQSGKVSETTKTVSKKQKKSLKKELRKKLKELKSSSQSSNSSGIDPVILAILSIIFPLAPLMMYLFEGDITTRFWISLILTLLFWLPGVIYNFLVMFGVI